MTETTEQMLTRIAAMPHTHKVLTTLADGRMLEHTTRNVASAENHAQHMRFRFGKTASVTVSKIEG